MSRDYGWTGSIRHGLWRCKCRHWNYYRTGTLRIDSRCRSQGCEYRARVVLDRTPRRGGRERQVLVHQYPSYRPPRSIKSEQRERNRFNRRNRELHERMKLPELGDRGVFHTAAALQAAQDEDDLQRTGGTWRFRARPDLKRHPEHGGSRLERQEQGANNDENDAQDPA